MSGRALAIVVAALVGPWIRGGAALAAPSLTAQDARQQADTLGFDLSVERDRERQVQFVGPRNGARYQGGVEQQFSVLRLDLSGEAYRRRRRRDTAPPQPYRHMFLSLSGATGLIDMPAAYTQPFKRWVVTMRSQRMLADSTYWPLPYRSIANSSRYFLLATGLTPDVEFELSIESWDRTFGYNDPRFAAPTPGPTFSVQDKFITGFGTKWVLHVPGTETVFSALGGRFQLFDNDDRTFIEFHEYDRIQNVYLALSGQATREVFGHALVRYISYDLRGGLSPAARTDSFPGFSPINDWTQLALGAEWFLFPNFEIFGELVKDTNITFLGGVNQIRANAGARFVTKAMGLEFWAKRLNHKGITENGLAYSYRF